MEAAHLEYQGMEPEVFHDIEEARRWLAADLTSALPRKPEGRSEEAEAFTSGASRRRAVRSGTTSRT
jgi:hypothetical protein